MRRAAAHLADATQPLLDAPRPWAPFVEADLAEVEERTGRPRPFGVTRAYSNGWFAVMVRPLPESWHLLIRNVPNTPVRSWTDLQRIKSELFGPQAVAVEVFPADDDVIDQANMTHLWVLEGHAGALIRHDYNLSVWHRASSACRAASATLDFPCTP